MRNRLQIPPLSLNSLRFARRERGGHSVFAAGVRVARLESLFRTFRRDGKSSRWCGDVEKVARTRVDGLLGRAIARRKGVPGVIRRAVVGSLP